MQLSLLVDKINALLSEQTDLIFNQKPKFVYGESFVQVVKTCSEIAPFSKVLILHAQNRFLQVGIRLNQKFKEAGLKPIYVVLPADNFLVEKSFFNSIPEDVRIVVCLDNELKDLAFNIASKLKLKAVVALNQIPSRLITPNALSCDGAFYIIDEGFKVDLAKEYSFCIGKIISLLDIRLNAYLKLTQNNYALEENFSILINKLLHLDITSENIMPEILALKFAMETLECCNKPTPPCLTHEQALYLLQKLTCTKITTPTNFVLLARERERKFCDNYLSLLKAYKQNSSLLNGYSEIEKLNKGLSAQAQKFLEYKTVILDNFKKLGGKNYQSNKDIRLKGALGEMNCVYLLMHLSRF